MKRRDLGYDWKKIPKFIDPSKGRIGCMDTFCGDRHQVKWEAYQWIMDAVSRISKPLTGQDREKLNRGKIMARKILKNMGAKDIWNGALGAAHPGGTCRIGHIVDSDLQTRYKNLFVSDGSVIPFEFGLPPVLTILSLSRRLSGHLMEAVL